MGGAGVDTGAASATGRSTVTSQGAPQAVADSRGYHAAAERFGTFLSRGRRPLLAVAAVFCTAYTSLLWSVDTTFFYPKVRGDALVYYLVADAAVDHRPLTPSLAENLPAQRYVVLPGLLRAPLFAFSTDFDVRLRLIQVANVIVLTLVGVLSAYFLSVASGGRWLGLCVAIPFTFLLTDSGWQQQAYLPLGDGMFALFILGALALLPALSREDVKRWRLPVVLVGYLALTTLAFLTKVTGLLLLLSGITLLGRRRSMRGWARVPLVLFVVVALGLLYAERDTVAFYIAAGMARMRLSHPSDWVLNLVGVAVPSQFVPNFANLYGRPPLEGTTFVGATSLRDAAALVLGCVLTSAVVWGGWRSRHALGPEVLLVLITIPILAPIVGATLRYLQAYQTVLWGLLLHGWHSTVGWRRTPHGPRLHRIPLLVLVLGLGVGLAQMRLNRAERELHVGPKGLLEAATGISSVYADLRQYLGSLPQERVRLVAPDGDLGRWKVLAGLEYHVADASLPAVARRYDVYAVWDCVDRAGQCHTLEAWLAHLNGALRPLGDFRIEPVFERSGRFARTAVFRVLPASDPGGQLPSTAGVLHGALLPQEP